MTQIRQLKGKFCSKETTQVEWNNHVSQKIHLISELKEW